MRNPATASGKGARARLEISHDTYSTIYAVGDVHGRYDLLREVEEKIAADLKGKSGGLVIYLGDYVDRGPNSARVLEHLSNGDRSSFDRICVCGNHDHLMAQYIRAPLRHSGWLALGGRQTLRSYAVDPDKLLALDRTGELLKRKMAERIPQSHIEFLDKAPVSIKIGNAFFVHAGIRPGIALDEQQESDLMWIREPFLSSGPKLPLIVVHGHTPSETISNGPNRIGLDTGAYATGNLSIIKLDKAFLTRQY